MNLPLFVSAMMRTDPVFLWPIESHLLCVKCTPRDKCASGKYLRLSHGLKALQKIGEQIKKLMMVIGLSLGGISNSNAACIFLTADPTIGTGIHGVEEFFKKTFPQLMDPNCVKRYLYSNSHQARIADGQAIESISTQFGICSADGGAFMDGNRFGVFLKYSGTNNHERFSCELR